MKRIGTACALSGLLLFSGGDDASAQSPAAQGSLMLPVAGRAAHGGRFTGTAAVSRFEVRGDQLVAIAFVTGTLTHGNRTLGTALIGETVIPVTVRAGGVAPVSGRAAPAQRLRRVVFSTAARGPGFNLAQAACPVVDLVLGPFNVNVLGADVSIPPIEIHLTGQEGTPLGDLVCEVSELIGNVSDLVGVVNNILSLLIGLLGGLTGGLGGAIPVI